MKKFGILAFSLALVLSVTACGDNGGTSGLDACDLSIGFVTDSGGIDDRSFNQGSYEGIVKFAEDNNMDEACYTFLESKTEADYVTNLSTLAEDGYDLVVAAGFLFEEAMTEVSAQFTDTKFLVIDTVVEADNVQSAVFAANEPSYLAGVAAAMEAKALGSDKVGFIGGMEFPVIGEFQAGFEQGALAANPDAKIYVDYAGSFEDAGIAQTLAAKQYDQGVKVIFHAAGNAGNGVIKEAQERSEKNDEVYVVGVDKDQYETGYYGDVIPAENDDEEDAQKSVILTSALKRVDVATYKAAEAMKAGDFKAETITYTLESDGVGYPEENPNLTEDIIKALDKAVADIKAGKIKVVTEPTIKNGSSN